MPRHYRRRPQTGSGSCWGRAVVMSTVRVSGSINAQRTLIQGQDREHDPHREGAEPRRERARRISGGTAATEDRRRGCRPARPRCSDAGSRRARGGAHRPGRTHPDERQGHDSPSAEADRCRCRAGEQDESHTTATAQAPTMSRLRPMRSESRPHTTVVAPNAIAATMPDAQHRRPAQARSGRAGAVAGEVGGPHVEEREQRDPGAGRRAGWPGPGGGTPRTAASRRGPPRRRADGGPARRSASRSIFRRT